MKNLAAGRCMACRGGEPTLTDEQITEFQPRARRTLMHLLRDLPITMLVSTHDMALVKGCFPRTIVVDEGKIVADGLTIDILEDEALLEAQGNVDLPQISESFDYPLIVEG